MSTAFIKKIKKSKFIFPLISNNIRMHNLLKSFNIIIIYILILINNKIYPEENSNGCVGKLGIFRIVECVLYHSPEYKSAKLEIGVQEGRRKIATYYTPSNPYLSISQAARKGSSDGIFSRKWNIRQWRDYDFSRIILILSKTN